MQREKGPLAVDSSIGGSHPPKSGRETEAREVGKAGLLTGGAKAPRQISLMMWVPASSGHPGPQVWAPHPAWLRLCYPNSSAPNMTGGWGALPAAPAGHFEVRGDWPTPPSV